MSDEKKKQKTAKDLPEVLRGLVKEEPKTGDLRRANRKFKKGKTFYFGDYERPLTLTEDITMDIEEEYNLGTDSWQLKSYYTDTAKPISRSADGDETEYVPLSRWRRLWRWFFGPAPLPPARLLK